MSIILLPFYILKFWYLEALVKLFTYFLHLNKVFLQLFSLPLLVKTYFRPWKNEYRQGLVGFSIAMGMFIKTFVILADLVLFLLLLFIELIAIVAFILWPFATIYFLLK